MKLLGANNIYNSRIPYIILPSLAACLISLLIGKSWPMLLWSLILSTVSLRLPNNLRSLLAARTLISGFTIIAMLQVESILFWCLGINVDTNIYCLVTMIIIITVSAVTYSDETKFDLSGLRPSIADLIIIIPALLITGGLYCRVITPTKSHDLSIVQELTFGVDDTSHIGMLGDLIRSDGNILSGKRAGEMAVTTRSSYPVGWHNSLSIVSSSLIDIKSGSILKTIKLYFYLKLFSLFTLIAALGVFIVSIFKSLGSKLSTIIELILAALTTLAISFVLFLPLYFDGFFSFLPALTFLLLFASIIAHGKDNNSKLAIDVVLCLFIAASALTWVLTAPILLVSFFIMKIVRHKKIRSIPISSYLLMFSAASALIAQIYILISKNGSNIVQAIAAEGGVAKPSHLILFVPLLVYVIYYSRGKKDNGPIYDISALVAPSAFALLSVYLYVSLKSASITYYFYKLQSVVLVLILPLMCVVLARQALDKAKGTLPQQIIGLMLVISLVGLSIPSIVGQDYLQNILAKIPGSGFPDQPTSLLISQSLDRKYLTTNSRIVYFLPDSSTELVSNIARLSFKSTECDLALYSSTYQKDIPAIISGLELCDSSLPPLTINTSPLGEAQLKSAIPESILIKHKVTILADA